MRKRRGWVFIIGLAFLGSCTYPSKKIESVNPDTLVQGHIITVPTKVYLKDGTIILFQAGFRAEEAAISGLGQRFAPDGTADPMAQSVRVPTQDIAAMNYYRKDIRAGTWVATALLDVSAPILIGSSTYCLLCPKCCFGSCPTAYVMANGQYQLAAEFFSFSVGRLMEADDIDLVADPGSAPSGPFEIRVTNEALETHEINFLQPLAVIHPARTSVHPDSANQLLLFRELQSPSAAYNSQGQDILESIARADDRAYRSPKEMVERLANGPFFDSLDLKVKVPPGTASVRLLLRIRNTLLSTLLFYDLVLGSQGFDALAWTEKMNTDADYAERFWRLYRFFSGIAVKIRTEAGWKLVGKVHDTGPMAFKRIAARVPTFGREDLDVRLEFVPDNFMIDAVWFDWTPESTESLTIRPLELDRVLDSKGRARPDVLALVAAKDDCYLITEPGQAYRFLFNLPSVSDEQSQVSVFMASRGFYNEWLRGKWLSVRPDPAYRFDINDVPGTVRQLARSWLSSKDMLEQNFFRARIPVRGER